MEISEKHYIILTQDGQFQKISRAPGSGFDIGDEVEGIRRRKRPRRAIGAWIAGAVALLLLFPMFMVPRTQAAPVVAYVTLDVNPSIEMGIDNKERVRELRGLNVQGSQVIIDVAYKGLNAAAVAAEIVDLASKSGTNGSSDGRDIVITSIMLDGKAKDPERFEAELDSDIHKAVTEKLHAGEPQALAGGMPNDDGVTVLSAPQEVREEAEKNGVSAGKMAVYLLVKSENPDVQLDTLKTQSIKEWTAPVGGIHRIVHPELPANAGQQSDLPTNKGDEPPSKEKRLLHAEARQKWEKQRLKALLKQEKTNAASNGDNKDTKTDNGKKEEQGEKENLNTNKQAPAQPKTTGKTDQPKGNGKDTNPKNQNRDDGRSDSNHTNNSSTKAQRPHHNEEGRPDNQQRGYGRDNDHSNSSGRNNDRQNSSRDKDNDRGDSDNKDQGNNRNDSNSNRNNGNNKNNHNDKSKENRQDKRD
nr:anti-sigma factor domain-containing protein [Paenibacillus sp. MMS18-CY102]